MKIASENECSGTANKKVHIDTCSTGEDLTPDANRVKETPVNSQPQHPDSNLHEESYTLFPTLSLKERFGHLLDDDTGKFSYE